MSSREKDYPYLLKVLEQTRQKLLDTTRRSRLLNYRESGLDIAIIDEMAGLVFEDLVLKDRSFFFDFLEKSDEDDFNDEADRVLPETRRDGGNLDSRYRDNRLQTPFSEGELARRLRRLYQEHNLRIGETGANSLFICMGLLEWSNPEHDNKPVRSPLMLIPVRLSRIGTAGSARYSLAFDGSALDTNHSLVEKLKKDFDINLPEIDGEEQPETYWRRVNSAVKPRHVDGWHIVREMTLGLFQFNKQVMWHDLNPDRWPDHAALVDNPVIKRLLIGPKEGEQEPGQISKEYMQDGEEADALVSSVKLIRDADSSQHSSLIDALKCHGGLVIEGPPGTGKSQTISNLIATALDQGLSVLFVAEKMAALEVVHKRLAESGLDPFCLQLHGLKASKKELLESIKNRMDCRVEQADPLSQKQSQLQQAKADLIAYSEIMTERAGPEDAHLYEIVWKIECLRQELPDAIEELTVDTKLEVEFSEFDATRNQLNDLGTIWSDVPENARNAWWGFLPGEYKERNEHEISTVLDASIDSLSKLSNFLFDNELQSTVPALFEVKRVLELSNCSIKDIPFGVCGELIANLVKKDALGDFQSLLKDIRIYLKSVEAVNQTFDYSSDKASDYAELLHSQSKALVGIVNPDVPINSLAAETEQLQAVINHLNSLHCKCRYLLERLNKVARTMDDFNELLTESQSLVDGPPELSLHANRHHARNSVKNYFDQASVVAQELARRTDRVSQQFVLSRIEHSQEVESAKNVIETNIGNYFALFKSEYRQAKKRVKKMLADPAQYEKSELFVDSLNTLYELCKETEEFASNEGFATALGSLFKGVATNWQKLQSLIDFSQALREQLGSENAEEILADWDAHLDTTVAIREKLDNSLQQITQYRQTHPLADAIWQRPVSAIANALSPRIEKLKLASDSLSRPWCRSTTNMRQAQQVAAKYQEARNCEREIEALPSLRDLLNGQWCRADTNIDNLQSTEAWISSTLQQPGMDIRILAWLFDQGSEPDRERFERLHRLIKHVSTNWKNQLAVLNRFGALNQAEWVGCSDRTIAGLNEKLRLAVETISHLPLMQRCSQTTQSLQAKGFGAITHLVAAGTLRGSQCGKAYEYCLYKTLFSKKVAANPRLSDFSQTQYQSTKDRFAKLDREIMQINAKQIAARLAGASIPSGVGSGPVADYSQKRLLAHEASKQRRHIPIRQLMKRAGEAVKALKPCFLMSPLSVAQYLGPGDIDFDLVIMDEASQLRPECALGAMARAEKSIIVGDPKQLPPTNFFDSSLPADDEDNANIMDDTDSILDVCLKQFPYRRLRWHYRSEHESLIQFSNEQFYAGDLIVFPSPKPDSRDYGVHYNFIDNPAYHNGRNRPEAERVIQEIIRHFYSHSNKSLRVVAFNRDQAEEISLLLDRARRQDPSLDSWIKGDADEPLFIKNLENVQGDERDVIFISTVYGPEKPGGPVTQRFGPINSDLGWRRLNVIATRAKQRVEIFTSMRHTDVGRGENPKRGVRALRDWLEFASTGKVTDKGVSTGRGPDSEFEVAVAGVIRNLGFQCEYQVGVAGFFIDIGVINPDRPGEYLIGIECDGASYHSSTSVRDRDRLRQEILEAKRWELHRIWSTNWFHSRSIEIDRLEKVLKGKVKEGRRKDQATADFEATPEAITEAPIVTEPELEQEIETAEERTA